LPGPQHIAVVDDDLSVREALGDLLEVAGLTIRTYGSGDALLEEHIARPFALVVTDLRMPQMDGITLLRRLRMTEGAPPVIVVTSSSEPSTRSRLLEEGAIACLVKPVDGDALLRLVTSTLDRLGNDPRKP
jgi:two-component system, LuxR family, response regulator FixJ